MKIISTHLWLVRSVMRHGAESERHHGPRAIWTREVIRLLIVGSNPSLATSGYLIPGSTVTTIGEFGMSHEWGCKIRGTYNGGVPKTYETRHRGDSMLVTNLHHFYLVI